ncbi:MAG: hypothetical protein ACXU8A_06410 [Burkholderiaceae bacterium]
MQSDFEFHYDQVMRASEGACLVKLRIAATLLGISVQTIYNQVSAGVFNFEVVKAGSRSYVRALDLARHIAGVSVASTANVSADFEDVKRPRGRPPKTMIAKRIYG